MPGQLQIGDRVTNGHWFGKVIARFGEWVWVQPNYAKDGPLTFKDSALSRAPLPASEPSA